MVVEREDRRLHPVLQAEFGQDAADVGALDTCSSASARWHSWSARSGWPTSWSSRCWNAARRSGCAGRSAPPGGRSGSSSWPRRSCCRWAAARPAFWPARPPPRCTPAPTAKPSSSRPTPGRRPGRCRRHRRPRRAAAGHPRRTPIPGAGTVEHLEPSRGTGAFMTRGRGPPTIPLVTQLPGHTASPFGTKDLHAERAGRVLRYSGTPREAPCSAPPMLALNLMLDVFLGDLRPPEDVPRTTRYALISV